MYAIPLAVKLLPALNVLVLGHSGSCDVIFLNLWLDENLRDTALVR
jgi:hypothetical protein